MSPAIITTLCTGIPAIIGAIAALIVAIRKPSSTEVSARVQNALDNHINTNHEP